MTAREEFNGMLNSCANPRAMYDALEALAKAWKDSPMDQQQKRAAIRGE